MQTLAKFSLSPHVYVPFGFDLHIILFSMLPIYKQTHTKAKPKNKYLKN